MKCLLLLLFCIHTFLSSLGLHIQQKNESNCVSKSKVGPSKIYCKTNCTGCPKKIVPFFYLFFLGVQCVESGVRCTDC
jgi:hypothetical protein